MNASPFWPLVWKEYRVGRAFWLAMVVITLVIQGSLCLRAKASPQRDLWLYATALTIAAGFMVGVGATMFAVEREERTFGFVRRLPIRPWQLALPKLLCALAGWGTLAGLLWLAAAAMTGWQFPSAGETGQLWIHWSMACLECLAWGVLFSLLLSSPLKAAALTMLAVFSVNFGFTSIAARDVIYFGTLAQYVAAVPKRLVLLALVAALDAWLLPRWLTDRIAWPEMKWPTRSRVRRTKRWVHWFRSDYWPPLGHLMWQAWREMADNWWALALVALGQLWVQPAIYEFAPVNRGVMVFLLLTLPVAIYGSLVFHADQVRGPRFLAERGVSARLVWLSRQIVSCGVLVAITIVVAGLTAVYQAWSDSLSVALESLPGQPFTARLSAPLLVAYAAGQVASHFVRRSLLAGVAAVALGVLMACWAHLMWALGIAWWWTVLPLVASCFAATWLHAPDWLLQRGGWRRWIAPAAALVLPAVLVFCGVACFRVYQIPNPSPKPVDWAELWHKALPTKSTDPIDAVARATDKRELYEKAFLLRGQFEVSEMDKQAIDDNKSTETQPNRQAFIDLMMAASRLDGPFWAKNWSDGRAVAEQLTGAARRLADVAEEETHEGNLDRALDIYFAVLRADIDAARWGGLPPSWNLTDRPASLAFRSLVQWSAAPGQTVGRIEEAIRRLQEFHAGLPQPESLVNALFEEAPELMAERLDELALMRYMPWERARARRLVDLLTLDELSKMNDFEWWLNRGIPIGEITLGTGRLYQWQKVEERWPGSTRMAKMLETTPFINDSGIAHAEPITAVLQLETDYRATLIILAVEAWKLEHGHFPAHLDEVLGGELKELPVDPVDGEPFGYFPNGLPDKPPAVTSFLWCTGRENMPDSAKPHWWWRLQKKGGAYFVP